MARIQEDIVLIKVSRLVSDVEEPAKIMTNDVLSQLEDLFTELAGPKSIVEIEKLDSAK